jgi:hypothetical protein
MTLTMFRISEFSEGKPGIKDCLFTSDQFIDAYSDEKGDIDYFSYWEGFNITVEVFNKFLYLFGEPDLSKREWSIMKYLHDNNIPDDGFFMCMVEGDLMTLRHETAHGYYFEDEEYRHKCMGLLDNLATLRHINNKLVRDGDVNCVYNRFYKHLLDMDYIGENIPDEMHAYLVAYDQEEWNECFPSIKYEEVKDVVEQIGKIFDDKNK